MFTYIRYICKGAKDTKIRLGVQIDRFHHAGPRKRKNTNINAITFSGSPRKTLSISIKEPSVSGCCEQITTEWQPLGAL